MRRLACFLITIAVLAAFAPPSSSQDASQRVSEAHRGPFAVINAEIVTVTNGTIERGAVVIEAGRISALGSDVPVPSGAEVIDADGLTIYPGMIDGGTHLGLAEIGSVHETVDYNEVGSVVPHMRALAAVNPNSVHIPITRVSGVTTVLTVPEGGLFPGTAALIDLHGYTPRQMSLGGFEAVALNFPVRPRLRGSDEEARRERDEAYEEAVDRLDEVWDGAELYARIDSAFRADPERSRRPEYAPEAAALTPVLRGERMLIIHANQAQTIEAALEWARSRDLLENVVLSGVLEGWRVAGAIAEAGVPCLVGPVLDLPGRPSDRYDKAYANAGLLHDAGVKIALRTNETENVRNLPYHAGFAAAYGLGREAALRAVTIDAAEIFGVAGEVGSVEVGKRANLFVADGDPFQPQTRIEYLFINGYRLPLDNRQLRLYEEFLDRNPGAEMHPTR